jgi:hypothetical protein
MRETHAAQHMRRLGELDVGVADDLDPVAPRVEEIRNGPGSGVMPAARIAWRAASLSSTTRPK